jgi:PAS domain S-box-containing protein
VRSWFPHRVPSEKRVSRPQDRPSFTAPPRAWLLGGALVLAALLAVGVGAQATLEGLARQRAVAEVNAHNLARLLETSLVASFDRIDLALRAVAEEYHRAGGPRGIDRAALEAFMERRRAGSPDLLSLRIAGADGRILYNAPPAEVGVSVADRDYFRALQGPGAGGLTVSHPYVGRIIATPLVIIARRLQGEDGRFEGVVLGSVTLARLGALLSEIDVGPHGIIALRHDDHSLVAAAGMQRGKVPFGDRHVSSRLEEVVASEHSDAVFEARTSADAVVRTQAFRKLDRYPLYVVVGLAPADHLGEWRRQTAIAWALVAAILVLIGGGASYGTAAWRRRLRHEQLLEEQTERLRESEERFRTAFLTSPDSVNLNRVSDGVYVAINEGFTRMTGWSEAEVLGRSSLALGIWVDPADRARLVAGLEHDGVVANLEARFRRKDGSTLVGLMSARRITLAGEPLLLSITRDVTAWKEAEAERDRLQLQFQEAQRLEGLGRLAGGVAHDFNNLLTVILGCAASLRERIGSAGDVAEDLDQIDTAAGRARDLTRQLLAFARKQVITPVPLDLSRVVKDGERLLRRVLGEDVSLTVRVDEPLWPVLCDPAQLEQVILNLAANARDAMPDGGALTIAARNAEFAADGSAGDGRPPGQWVCVSVRDAGVGMAPEVKAHLFEPFFTTKAHGKGTGLGLATVHGIVAQSGGHLEVESAPGQGTTITVYLPRATAAPAEPPAATPAPLPAPVSGTILVIEDDPLVRGVTVRALRSRGYDVLVAESGEQAVALAAGREGRIDLVVSDVIMPGAAGPQVVERLRLARPGLPALFVSGYPRDAILHRGVLDAGVEFLPKPFSPAALLERVRALVAACRVDG